MTTGSGLTNNLDFFTMRNEFSILTFCGEHPYSKVASLLFVATVHAGLLAFIFGSSPKLVTPLESHLIQATIHTLIPRQSLSQEAKPLPAKAKPKPRPKSTMIAAPLAPATDADSNAVVAPSPEATGISADENEGDEVSPPVGDADYLSNPAPEYPRLSRRAKEEGKVLIRVYVEENGSPSEVKLEQSSGFERLDRSAMAAVGQWKFVPARKGEKNVAAWVLVPIVFKLEG